MLTKKETVERVYSYSLLAGYRFTIAYYFLGIRLYKRVLFREKDTPVDFGAVV